MGDSSCILGRTSKKSKRVQVQQLTIDHKPQLPTEKKRIVQSGGEVRKLEGDVPHRVFVRGRAFPGLAMSRAIGDQIANAVGVSSEPDVNVFPIEANDEFVILASDGVWEFLKPKTVGEAAHQRG